MNLVGLFSATGRRRIRRGLFAVLMMAMVAAPAVTAYAEMPSHDLQPHSQSHDHSGTNSLDTTAGDAIGHCGPQSCSPTSASDFNAVALRSGTVLSRVRFVSGDEFLTSQYLDREPPVPKTDVATF